MANHHPYRSVSGTNGYVLNGTRHLSEATNSDTEKSAIKRQTPENMDRVRRVTQFGQDMSTLISADQGYGWERVQKNLPRITEYGRKEGILPPAGEAPKTGIITGIVTQAQEEVQQVEKKERDRVQIPTNDVSTIHEAIPFLPVPPAVLCLILNLCIPGTGTILSGIFCFCMGQPRIQLKEGRLVATFAINFAIGVSQFMTITFFLVGWFWSLAWGGLLLIHSMQYREALLQKRQEAVATAAIEAITKDSILHRRDVRNLVKDQKDNKGKKGSSKGLKFLNKIKP